MMTSDERQTALVKMDSVSKDFYAAATQIGVHPFIEFCGLMREYIKACEAAHAKGIDFTECNAHSGLDLPMAPHMVAYVNEKLECIFTGRSVMDVGRTRSGPFEDLIPPSQRCFD